jgi:hypothetical protein
MRAITEVTFAQRGKAADNLDPSFVFSSDIMVTRGGKFHYVGWKHGPPNADAITDIRVFTYGEAQSNPPTGWLWIPTDLSIDHGGDSFKYLCWKKVPGQAPVTDLMVLFCNSKAPPHRDGWTVCSGDLQEDCGGDMFVYVYYKKE